MPWSRRRRRSSYWPSSGRSRTPTFEAVIWARSSDNCRSFKRQVFGSSAKYLSASIPRRSNCSSCDCRWVKLLLRLGPDVIGHSYANKLIRKEKHELHLHASYVLPSESKPLAGAQIPVSGPPKISIARSASSAVSPRAGLVNTQRRLPRIGSMAIRSSSSTTQRQTSG